MGFLDRLLGRKKADEPHTAPDPAPMPQSDTGTAEHTRDRNGASVADRVVFGERRSFDGQACRGHEDRPAVTPRRIPLEQSLLDSHRRAGRSAKGVTASRLRLRRPPPQSERNPQSAIGKPSLGLPTVIHPLPPGTRDVLPEEARELRLLTDRLLFDSGSAVINPGAFRALVFRKRTP